MTRATRTTTTTRRMKRRRGDDKGDDDDYETVSGETRTTRHPYQSSSLSCRNLALPIPKLAHIFDIASMKP